MEDLEQSRTDQGSDEENDFMTSKEVLGILETVNKFQNKHSCLIVSYKNNAIILF